MARPGMVSGHRERVRVDDAAGVSA
jgi:hypothetical protein